jgi:hypothetical protein
LVTMSSSEKRIECGRMRRLWFLVRDGGQWRGTDSRGEMVPRSEKASPWARCRDKTVNDVPPANLFRSNWGPTFDRKNGIEDGIRQLEEWHYMNIVQAGHPS